MDYLTVTEAAEALQLSVPTIKRYIYDGKLKSAKLPGGQHRIPRSEIEKILTPDESRESEEPGMTGEDRLAVIERWLSDLQAEVDRLGSTMQVVSSYCARLAGDGEQPQGARGEAQRLYVLGTGCAKCDQLYELATQALVMLGREDVQVERVRDPMDIAAHGPVLTPALVCGDHVLLSGRVPSAAALREILEEHLEPA